MIGALLLCVVLIGLPIKVLSYMITSFFDKDPLLKIKLWKTSSYENRKTPIYKIEQDKYDGQWEIVKYEQDWNNSNWSILSMLFLLWPVMILSWQYVRRSPIIIKGATSSNLNEYSLDYLIKYYEDAYAKIINELEETSIKNKAKENTIDKINKEFNENYI